MMELSHSLTLNEEALKQIAEAKRPVFVFEWLRFLDKVLVAAQKSDIKGCQKKLVEQLTNQIHESPGPPTRKLIARCLSTLFSVGDTFLLFDTVNKCSDILKNKDDSPSYLPTRLAAIAAVGAMYEKLGRMMGRSYEETVQVLIKALRNAESQARIEIMVTLEKVCTGMGTAAASVHKDIYKAAKHCMTDRVMAVRCAAARCLIEMLNHAPFLHTSELESLASLCFRSFDGSNYDVRCTVAKLLGTLMATTQLWQLQKTSMSHQQMKGNQSAQQNRPPKVTSLKEALLILMSGFLRGGIGFLKGTGEMIKGSSGVSREVRVGVTHAYVHFVQIIGGLWLERNISIILSHVLELVSNPKAATSHVDAVYSRKCVAFILRSVLGRMLGEKAQISACKEIGQLILKQMNTLDFSPENAKDCNQETMFSQHLLVCALQEVGGLVHGLGTTAEHLLTDQSLNMIDAAFAVLIHPSQAARLAAAGCLRSVCLAVPSQLTPVIDRCNEGLEKMRTSPEAIAGYSSALAALLGMAHMCPLGIPHTRGKIIFNTAEELLRSANQNSRLSLQRTQAGWMLIGAIMCLGVPVVKGLLPRMLLLWRNSFPRSTKELESEKARGDAFTWQVTLEGRAGALSSMFSFLQNCPEIVTEDIIRRLLTPVEAALAMLSNISGVLKANGQHLKASAAIVRLRLYETLSLLPPETFEGSYTHLLRLLVAEFTLTENQANTTTSHLRLVCHTDDSVILGSWLQETDHKSIEDQLQPNSASGSGALEHDPCSLYRPVTEGEFGPGPLPLGVAVIDMSVVLFGQIFPRVANKHRLQMLEHFMECIRQAKSSRQEAIQINIFTAVLSGLKGLADSKSSFGQEDVKKAAANLILGALTNSNPILRCAAGEALGRMAQVVGDSRFVAEMAQNSFDKLKSARDVVSRTGHSLALGCLHRYVGGMGSSQHLSTSVSILLALAQDTTSPVVQVWSLHALALIADSGGPMFRGYVEPSLSLALKLLLNVPPANVDVLQCIGKCLSALITTVGPELQGNTNSICTARSSFLCACAIMQDHPDPLVQAEATSCLQQLHMFAPRHVNLSSLVPNLCRTLSSGHLLLRRAAISCLRQLAQREAREVCEHAMTLANEGKEKDMNNVEGLVITETGLPGVLFGMLDTESDKKLVKDIHDTLHSMLHTLAEDNLAGWIILCKDVLTVSADAGSSEEGEVYCVEGEGDDEEHFHTSDEASTHPSVQPRWPTRTFAAECVRKIISVCEGNRVHFDLALAKEMQLTSSKGDYLVLHLSDIVRMAFMAATSDSDYLRMEGLRTLQVIIEKFAQVPEPEFPGHVILEQYQAQVGAALRPAFSPETPPHVTAMACQVCSTWIGSGVARDLNDLRRVHQLLVSSLNKLRKGSSTQMYNESASTLEKLAILKAWSEVYIVAMKTGDRLKQESSKMESSLASSISEDFADIEVPGENLLSLVQPELVNLSKHWLAALKDHALLSLPPEFASQLPHDGGAFYTNDTMESAQPYYRNAWPSILHAAALWLNNGGFENVHREKSEVDVTGSANLGLGPVNAAASKSSEDINTDRFHLMFGICMEALCCPRSPESLECVMVCLQALYTLLESAWPRSVLCKDMSLPIELCNVLHRVLLTHENLSAQLLVLDVLEQLIKAAQEHLESNKRKKLKEIIPANQEPKDNPEIDLLGEGGDSGEIIPGKSVSFSVLEVCLCVLIRQLPALNPAISANSVMTIHSMLKGTMLTEEQGKLVAAAVSSMEKLPQLCSPKGAVAILPTILFLTTGVVRETATKNVRDTGILATVVPVSASLHCLKTLASHRYSKDTRSNDDWNRLLQSALAKILDLAKPGSEENRLDEVTVCTAIAELVLYAPSEVTCVPNLQCPCIDEFKQALQSSSILIQVKCIQILQPIFQHSDRAVSAPYIQALAPRIIEILYTEGSKRLTTESEFNLTVACIETLEILLGLAEPQHRIQMLTLLVPILISFLLEGIALKEANHYCQSLHTYSLQKLMKIGPQYPQEFRTLMLQSGELRTKLETAVKVSQGAQKAKSETVASKPLSVQTPSIKLKTDFSNFTG